MIITYTMIIVFSNPNTKKKDLKVMFGNKGEDTIQWMGGLLRDCEGK
jgi:hypothetical protein